MLDHSTVAVVGRVHHLQTAIVRDEVDGRGALIVAIDPTEEWKGNAQAADGLVYFAVPRPKNLGLETYEQAMPAGTRIVFFGGIHEPATDFASGDPGVTTYVPDRKACSLPSRVQDLRTCGPRNLRTNGATSTTWKPPGSDLGRVSPEASIWLS